MQDIIGSLEDNNLTYGVKILYGTSYLSDIINEILDTAFSLNQLLSLDSTLTDKVDCFTEVGTVSCIELNQMLGAYLFSQDSFIPYFN